MPSFNEQIEFLQSSGFLPTEDYLSAKRFGPYENTNQFFGGLASPIFWPIANGLAAGFYAVKAVWATLRTVGNLFICKPRAAGDAVDDLCIDLSLSIALAVMAPIHTLSYLVELLLRTISSWIVGKELTDDLKELGFGDKLVEETQELTHVLPSKSYFKKARFFSPYKDVVEFLGGVVSPLTTPFETGFNSLQQAVDCLNAALHCITNVVINKPQHAKESFSDFGVHLSLSVALAVMVPINAVVEGIALIGRLGTTWVSACMEDEDYGRRRPHANSY